MRRLKVLSFVRQKDSDKVFAVFNFSNEPQTVTFVDSLYHGQYVDYFSQESVELHGSTTGLPEFVALEAIGFLRRYTEENE